MYNCICDCVCLVLDSNISYSCSFQDDRLFPQAYGLEFLIVDVCPSEIDRRTHPCQAITLPTWAIIDDITQLLYGICSGLRFALSLWKWHVPDNLLSFLPGFHFHGTCMWKWTFQYTFGQVNFFPTHVYSFTPLQARALLRQVCFGGEMSWVCICWCHYNRIKLGNRAWKVHRIGVTWANWAWNGCPQFHRVLSLLICGKTAFTTNILNINNKIPCNMSAITQAVNCCEYSVVRISLCPSLSCYLYDA